MYKKFIKETIIKSILNEKTYNIDDDVDLIYDLFFKKDIDKAAKTGKVTKRMFKQSSTDTSILKSEECLEAHEINPCKILINLIDSNHYDPSKKIISLSVNRAAVAVAMDYGGNIDYAATKLDNGNVFIQEFKKTKIKGSIRHELIHWIDDTLNNKHIFKTLEKAQKRNSNTVFKNRNVNSSTIEIQAQIGNVIELRRNYTDLWDDISFKDLIGLSPSLNNISNLLKGNERKEWLKKLKSRLYREGLLGKNMY